MRMHSLTVPAAAILAMLWPACALARAQDKDGGPAASQADVNSILDEIKLVPPARQGRAGTDPLTGKLPPFSARALSAYQPDNYKSIDELRKRYKGEPQAFARRQPVRAVVFEAIEEMQKSAKIVMRDSIKGPINPKEKAAFLKLQSEPGQMIFELEQVLGRMRTAREESLAKETSKRWQANFEFTEARLKARIVAIYEYSYLLGQIRLDSLPALAKGDTGWRMEPRPKISVTEPIAKRYAKEVATAWRDIQKNHPDTPWAVIADRESQFGLGLEWRAVKE
jgi:hypothetical protein